LGLIGGNGFAPVPKVVGRKHGNDSL
jgi:hypothetical protein